MATRDDLDAAQLRQRIANDRAERAVKEMNRLGDLRGADADRRDTDDDRRSADDVRRVADDERRIEDDKRRSDQPPSSAPESPQPDTSENS